MEIKKITYGIISALIAIVLIAAVLVPVTSESTTHEETNDGYLFTMTDKIGDYTYTVDSNKDTLVNGVILDVSASAPSQYYAGVSSATFGASHLNINAGLWVTGEGMSAVSTNATSAVVTAAGTWTANGATGNIDTEHKAFYAVNGGEYGVYTSASTIKVNQGEAVYFLNQYGQCTVDTSTYGLTYQVSIVDGVATLDYANIIKAGVVTDVSDVTTVTAVYSDMVIEDGVTTYTNISASISITGYSLQTQGYTVAPLTYDVRETGAVYTMITLIPLLIVVGLVMGVIGLVISRRD